MIGCCSQEMDTLTQERHSSTSLLSLGSGCHRLHSLSQEETGKEMKKIQKPNLSFYWNRNKSEGNRNLWEANSDEQKNI